MHSSGDPSETELPAILERLDALIDWERRDRAGMRVGLDPMRDLMERLAHPERACPVVHVGGTKGKGSVCALIAAGLEGAGLRVGLYASPHVERINERVSVGGRPVSDASLARGLEAALQAREAALAAGSAGSEATWFDVVTAAAFRIFAGEELDWAVVEVGLGGRLDSTNVVEPEVALITGVDLEHTAVLGDTRARIAREKGGILTRGATFVNGVRPGPSGRPGRDSAESGSDDAGAVLLQLARELELEVRSVDVAPEAGIGACNRALAAAALDALGARGQRAPGGQLLSSVLLDPTAEAAARLPGRLERRSYRGLPVVLDGAHVPSSLELVLGELAADPGLAGPPQVVLSVARDKDLAGLLKALAGRVDRVHGTSVPSGIHLPSGELTEQARRAGLEAVEIAGAAEALAAAARRASPAGWVLVTGSLYLVGALRARLDPPSADPRTPC